MKRILLLLGFVVLFLSLPSFSYAAAVNPQVDVYTSNTLSALTLLAGVAAVFFLIKGGYLYITSSGKPDAIEEAKKTIKNALIGLVIVLSASVIVSIFRTAMTAPTTATSSSPLELVQINTVKPANGLAQIMVDGVSGFLQTITDSAIKPIVEGIFSFLTSTPSVLSNSVIFNFWLISLGIVDSLFVLVVALLGLQFMSASTFGFEELEFKHLLPRIGLAFLGANMSLFLADYLITTCNVLVSSVLNATGGLNQAWLVNAITFQNLLNQSIPPVTLVFLALFLVVAVVLLLMYISRLILISLGAVLSPFIFLLWLIPKFSDFAEISIKSYVVTVFSIFVHVVVIQLASSYLVFPQSTGNSLISVLVAIGLLFTLIRIPHIMMYLVVYTSRNGTFKKIGAQMMNMLSSEKSPSSPKVVPQEGSGIKTARKVLHT